MRIDWQRAYQKASEILGERTKQRNKLRAELKRLRGIERATMFGLPRKDVVQWLRAQARLSGMPLSPWLNLIADALEVKP